MKCWACQNKQNIPGDCHISCKNPPQKVEQIGSGGKERYTKAFEMAITNKSVVRCVWPGSGWYPLCFDGNTIFGCANYQEVADATKSTDTDGR